MAMLCLRGIFRCRVLSRPQHVFDVTPRSIGGYLIRNPARHCFHPGATNLARNRIGTFIRTGEKEVKGPAMVAAIVSYIWPKDNPDIKRRVSIALVLLIGAKVINISVPFFFKHAVDKLGNLKLATPEEAVVSVVISLLLGYGIARVGAVGFSELRNAVFARVAHHSIRRIALNVFRHLHKLDLSFHLNRQTGALSKTIDRGSRGITTVLNAVVFNIVPTLFELGLVSLILANRCGSQFSAVAMGTVGMYAVFTLSVTRWRTQFRLNMNKAENEASNQAIDSLINYETVKYFNNEEFEARQYDRSLVKYENASLKTSTSLAFLNFGQNAIFSAALSAIMMMAAREIIAGNMTVGDLVMVNGLLFQLSIPLNFLGSVYREINLALTDMQVMFQLMRQNPQVVDNVHSKDLQLVANEADITFENVCFEYVAGKRIFDNLSFTVPSGKRIAIVGGSGTGKSSLIRLLYRFYEPTSGSIKIGGKVVDNLTLDSVRAAIAIVPQDPVLLHNTIGHNIAYGNLKSSQKEIENAAAMAGIHESILTWPQGYDTQVGERGLKLSGGEKQRVAIARAILKNSPILIFDEATSSLDSITETSIMRALDEATKGRTSILIAHRLSTVVNSDLILVLAEGRVVERGSHGQLLSVKDSLYSKLWHSQHRSATTKTTNAMDCDN